MKHSPLHERHLALNAKMADFGGWLMPIEYPGSGVLAEHTAVRERVGIFDVSHLGKASVTGAGALTFLNSQVTNDLEKIGDGSAQYNLLCNKDGGVIDDLIIYRKSPEDLFLIPNAANTSAVVDVLSASAPAGVVVKNLHEEFAVIAVQGPRSRDLLGKLGLDTSIDYMAFTEVEISGHRAILCRTGYTGEIGFELLPRWKDATVVWDALVEAMGEFDGAICGLGARDTLRTEMAYPLHGHELSLDITPVHAAATWAVAWDKEFVGKESLLAMKSDQLIPRIRGIKSLDRGIPRAGMRVLRGQDDVGVVTSGTFSPTLKVGIGLALLPREIKVGDHLTVDVRGRMSRVEVIALPFHPAQVR